MIAGALLASPAFAFAATQSAFSGTVSSVYPCSDLSGSYLVAFSGSASPVVYQKGVSQSVHGSVVPQVGQYLFGLSTGGGVSCGTAQGASSVISFYASTTPSTVTAANSAFSSGTYGSNGGSFSGGNSLLGSLGSSVSSLLGGVASQAVSGALSSALGSATGAAGVGMGIFGGFITPVGVCDNGIPYWVTGIPYTGPMIWIPGASSAPPYRYALGSPPVAGFIIGHYVTATCIVPPAEPIPMPMMFGYGTGLP